MSRFGAELKRASMLRVAAAASRENCGWSCFESVGCGSICPLSSRGRCACLAGGSKETPTVAQAGIGGKLYSAPPTGATAQSQDSWGAGGGGGGGGGRGRGAGGGGARVLVVERSR